MDDSWDLSNPWWWLERSISPIAFIITVSIPRIAEWRLEKAAANQLFNPKDTVGRTDDVIREMNSCRKRRRRQFVYNITVITAFGIAYIFLLTMPITGIAIAYFHALHKVCPAVTDINELLGYTE